MHTGPTSRSTPPVALAQGYQNSSARCSKRCLYFPLLCFEGYRERATILLGDHDLRPALSRPAVVAVGSSVADVGQLTLLKSDLTRQSPTCGL